MSVELAEEMRFPSLDSMRAAHTLLLKRQRDKGDTPELIASLEDFIKRGRATGALLDEDRERWAAQSMLDYWSTRLYRPGYEPPDAALADFDPNLAPELPDELSPYLGLDAFTESKREVFFGRKRLIAELVEKLKASRLLAVLGPSGSGKSSVVRAGLIPTLKGGALPGSKKWFYFPVMVPGSNPLNNLALALRPQNISSDVRTSEVTAEAERYRRDSGHLAKSIAERFSGNVVLVVDQFEEIFTLTADDEVRQAFVNNLVGLAQSSGAPKGGHRVILTMRSDFEPQLGRLPDFQSLFEQAVVRVPPLTAAELREAIEAPAKMIGLKFEEGVVDALLNDILGEPAALPLLQFSLLKLWENRERNRITWEAYRRLGGGRMALARAADEFYNNLIPEEQVTARRILLKLVRPGEGTEVTSSRIRRADLYIKTDAIDRVDRVLEKFLKARLLRSSQTAGETEADEQIEVAHEALVRNWPRLVDWLEDERTSLRQRARLTTAAEQWQRLGKDPSALWRGLLLDEARRYDDLNALEAEFVQASQAAVEAEEEAKRLAEEQALRAEMAEKVANVERQRAQDQARAAVKMRRRLLIASIALGLAVVMAIVAIGLGAQANASANQALRAGATADANAALAATAQVNAEAASTQAVAEQAKAEAETARAEAAERTARARLLTAQARTLYDTDPLLGLSLALEGLALIPAESPQREEFVEAVRSLMIQGRVLNFGNDIEAVYPSRDAALLVFDRENKPGEVYRTADGSRLTTLRADLREAELLTDFREDEAVTFSPDPNTLYYTVVYTNTSAELRLTSDSTVIRDFEPGIETFVFSPDPQATYLLAYSADDPDRPQLYRSQDGEQIAPDKRINHLVFSSEPDVSYFAIIYVNGTAEVRRTATGDVLFQPNGRVQDIVFSHDPQTTYFAVQYVDSAGELYRTASPNQPVDALTGTLQSIEFPDAEGKYIFLSYTNSTGLLRLTQPGSPPIFTITGRVRGVFFSPQATYFGIVYYGGQADLIRTASRQRIATLTEDNYEFIEFPDPDEKYFILYNEFGRQELRRTSDGQPVRLGAAIQDSQSSLAESDAPQVDNSYYFYEVTFSRDPGVTYFAVNYYNETAELRRTDTGEIVSFPGRVAKVEFSNDQESKYIIVYFKNAPTELYRITDLTKPAARLNGEAALWARVNFSPDPNGRYFAVTYETDLGELWTAPAGAPRWLAPLGLAVLDNWFDVQSQRFVVYHYHHQAYLLDLILLSELDGNPKVLSPEVLITYGCDLLEREKFDSAKLADYLQGDPPKACPSAP